MKLKNKLLTIPFVAFFLMMFSAGLIGSDNIREMEWLFPDNKAHILYLIWIGILAVFIPLQHFISRKKKD